MSEKLEGIFSKHNILVHLKLKNSLRQRVFHSKHKTFKQGGVVYAVQCSEDCADLYIGETKHNLHKHMAQYRRTSSSGPDSAAPLHLKEKGHSLGDSNVHVLDKKD